MTDALRVRNLTKRYGGRTVLKGVDLTVRRGEIYALLGANGAGKTTALECIEGLRPRDGGEIAVNGRVGIQLQSASLQAYIRPTEALGLVAKWKGRAPDRAITEALGIYGFAKKKYADLSVGQKRRLHLALALVGDPEILFLDEPTAGLDVEGRRSLHALIKDLRAQGKTMVLASHDMAEVEELCDRIAILKDGAIVFEGTIGELTAAVGRRYTVYITTAAGRFRFDTEDLAATVSEKLAEYRRAGTEILDIRTDRGTLEEHFMSIAKGAEQ